MFDKDDLPTLQKLPWYKPLTEWTERDARSLQVKSGLSRHVVRFIKVRRKSFAIKETSAETAEKEYNSYVQLWGMEVPTLRPVGRVIREDRRILSETKAVSQVESDSTGYVITRLLEYSIPHYHLFKRAFTTVNRISFGMRSSVIRSASSEGSLLGRCSLSNMMIVFANQLVPEIASGPCCGRSCRRRDG